MGSSKSRILFLITADPITLPNEPYTKRRYPFSSPLLPDTPRRCPSSRTPPMILISPAARLRLSSSSRALVEMREHKLCRRYVRPSRGGAVDGRLAWMARRGEATDTSAHRAPCDKEATQRY